MTGLFVSEITLILTAFAALALRRSERWSGRVGAGGVVTGCVLGLIPSAQVLLGHPAQAVSLPWSVPLASFSVGLDALSAFFLLPILTLSALAAICGGEFLRDPARPGSAGAGWFFFSLLVAGMTLTVAARNAVLFLLAWEVMSLASFFLVTARSGQRRVRRAGWTYLVATHLGTAFLLFLFAALGDGAPVLDFDLFTAPASEAARSALFLLALIGFGTKAGLMPFHVWLPEAHPAAPSHVSAVMSGVMIKTGFYGLLRVLLFLGPPPLWWGVFLVGLGLVSGILGVLFALAQHDLKRLLAYHSVENVGIIAMGLGLGLIGLSTGSPAVAALGFGGGLLHVVNHALFKGLLFLGAGAVDHAAGTRELDRLGGLLRRMPWTGLTFLTGAVAITGLPPLNGFVSEFLIFLGALRGGMELATPAAVAALSIVAGLGLIAGLAAACFTKAFGVVFLGLPRSEGAAHAHEAGASLRYATVALASGCLGIGLLAPLVPLPLRPAVAELCGLPQGAIGQSLAVARTPLLFIAMTSALLLALAGALAALRNRLLAGREVARAVTWDCGYALPSARMQYTGSSFAQPLMEFHRAFVRTRRRGEPPRGIFPTGAAVVTRTPDIVREGFYRPLFAGISGALGRLRWLQHGRVHLYVLYIAVTLLVLLIWKLG